MTYEQKLDALRAACDADIHSIPEVIARKLAYYDACHDLAVANGDRHGANNWAQMRMLALRIRSLA